MESPIVTLTTDWGTRDFFAGMVKGRLCSFIPQVRIVDITHSITPYDLQQATFIVKNACLNFPPNTIHIIDVDSTETNQQKFVAVLFRKQYFICTDNGLPFLLFGDNCTAVHIQLPQQPESKTFAAYDTFCKTAAILAADHPMDALGPKVEALQRAVLGRPSLNGNEMSLIVTYIDSYGNAYLNITFNEFEQVRNGRAFNLSVREYDITRCADNYYAPSSVPSCRTALLLVVSATGNLEIAVHKGNAAKLCGLKVRDTVKVNFIS